MLLYIKETIPAYEVQLQEEADCNEDILWCTLVTGYNSYHWSSISLSQHITKQNNEKIHTAISEVSKGVL